VRKRCSVGVVRVRVAERVALWVAGCVFFGAARGMLWGGCRFLVAAAHAESPLPYLSETRIRTVMATEGWAGWVIAKLIYGDRREWATRHS